MSQENVEFIRMLFERFNRDGSLSEELWHPDAVLTNFRESPIPGPYRGHEGVRKWREELFEVFEEGRFRCTADAGRPDRCSSEQASAD